MIEDINKKIRQEFAETMLEVGRIDPRLVVMVADISHFIFQPFAKECPGRYYNIGICEPTMMNMASGLAKTGFIPVIHTIAPFLIERSFEQIKLDLGYQKVGANIISVGAGFDYGSLGCTHHCYDDFALLKNVEGMQIIYPSSCKEFNLLFKQTYNNGFPTYFRLPETKHDVKFDDEKIVFGKGILVKEGQDISIVVVGPHLKRALEASKRLEEKQISAEVLYFHTIKPFDEELLKKSLNKTQKCLVIEEHSMYGGVFEEVLRSSKDLQVKYSSINLKDKYVHEYGSYEEHCENLGFCVENILKKTQELMQESNLEDSKFHKYHEELTEKIYNTPGMLPSRYVFVLTNMCNLRCSFCFQEKGPTEKTMTGDDWISFAKQLPEYSRVTLTGGEPLIFNEFKKVFSYAAEKFDCNIITNGLLLTKEKIDFLLSFPKFRVLSVSIDDIGNKSRGLSKEQWEYLVDILKYFAKRKKELDSECILDVKTMILDKNAGELFELYKYLVEEIKIDTHAFQLLKGSPIQHADYMFKFEDILKNAEAHVHENFEKIKEQLEKIREYNIKNKKKSFLHPKIASLISENPLENIDFINKAHYDKDNYSPCKFPWSSVHINFDGTLFPCLSVDMGNVKDKLLKDIISGEAFTNFKTLIKEQGLVGACNRCGWLRLRDKNV